VGFATITLSISVVRTEETLVTVLVSPEVGERDSARRYQRVLVLVMVPSAIKSALFQFSFRIRQAYNPK
jgi:hypothetical protein